MARRCSQRSQRPSRLEHRRRRRRAAAGRARARARDECGARQCRTDRALHRFDRAASGRSGAVDSRAHRGNGCGTSGYAAHHRRQSRVHGARGSSVRRSDAQGSGARASEPARERDVGDFALADSGSAFPRGMERRARIRRHGVDRAAAHRAALRRPLRTRSARDAERSAGAHGISDRAGVLAVHGAVRRENRCTGDTGIQASVPGRFREILATHCARRRDSKLCPANAHDYTCWPDRRVRSGSCPLPAASRSRSGPTPPSSTAGSTTTAGCRSCRSRLPT